MTYIDTHTHIYLSEFDADRAACISRATTEGVISLYMPAVDASTHQKMLEVEHQFPACVAMMGVHPCSVKTDFEKEIQVAESYLRERKFIAIGEIGLDFYWDKTFTKEQYQAFHYQIQLALEFHYPIVIHSRNAIDECIEVVQQYPALKGVFHCFSGNIDQAQKIITADFLLGIGGVKLLRALGISPSVYHINEGRPAFLHWQVIRTHMDTFKNAGLDKVIAHTGLNNIILETDAPYLAPVPYRGKRNEPSYTILVAEKIASLLQISVEDVASITTTNAKKLFGH
ncbi:MAG: TatD family hydrolase [Bacteroidota bacterium]